MLTTTEQQFPLLLLVLGTPPPIRVARVGTLDIPEAVEHSLAQFDDQQDLLTAGVREAVAWITWAELALAVRRATDRLDVADRPWPPRSGGWPTRSTARSPGTAELKLPLVRVLSPRRAGARPVHVSVRLGWMVGRRSPRISAAAGCPIGRDASEAFLTHGGHVDRLACARRLSIPTQQLAVVKGTKHATKTPQVDPPAQTPGAEAEADQRSWLGKAVAYLDDNSLPRDLLIAGLVVAAGFFLEARFAERQEALEDARGERQVEVEDARADRQEVLENTRFVRQLALDQSGSVKPLTSIKLHRATLQGLPLACAELKERTGCADLTGADLSYAPSCTPRT